MWPWERGHPRRPGGSHNRGGEDGRAPRGFAVREMLRRLVRHRTGRVVLVVLGTLGLLCALAPVLAPVGPDAGSLSQTLRRPEAGHWLGTDELGRDVLARLLWGGRVSLSVVL